MKELQNIGKILRNYRIKMGFTQSDIADMLNIPLTSYANAEQGKQKLNIDYLLELIKVCGVSKPDKNIILNSYEQYENSKKAKVILSQREYNKLQAEIEHYKELYRNEKKRVEKIKKTIDKI